MGNIFFFDWELHLMEWIQSLQSDFLTGLATLITMLGEEYLMICILGVCYWCINKELGKRVALSLSGTLLCGLVLKGTFQRRRPYMDNESITCIRAAHPGEDIASVDLQGYSLPSLHSAMSASTYGTLAIKTKHIVWKILAVVLPLCIGLTRIYLGVHYPTDVMIGWGIGIVSMLALTAIDKRFGFRRAFACSLAVGTLGLFICTDNEFFSGYGTVVGAFLGLLFEERFVQFEKASHAPAYVLRPLFGVLIFFAINTLIKLPFRMISSDDHFVLTAAIRLIRYALATFAIIGPYPLLFSRWKPLK